MITRFGAGNSASIQAAPPLGVNVEAQRRQPTWRVRRDFGPQARNFAPLAIGSAAEMICGMNAKRKVLGKPLEGRLNLTGGWRRSAVGAFPTAHA